MSGPRSIWGTGYPVTDEDLQRMADDAVAAGDEPLGLLAGTGASSEIVAPLLADGLDLGGLIISPSATQGKAKMAPAALLKRLDTAAPIDIAGVSYVDLDSATFPTNPNGFSEDHTLYAEVKRVVTATGARRIKSAISGAVSTQTVNLADAVTIALKVSTSTSYPADDPSAGVYYFGLAVVNLPAGYNPATTPISASWIKQAATWHRGWLSPQRVQRYEKLDAYSPAAGDTYLGSQVGKGLRAAGVYRYTSALNGVLSTLDSRDWRKRAVQIRLLRASASAGTYPKPHLITANDASTNRSIDTGLQFTGTSGKFFDSGGSPMTLEFHVDASTGALKIKISTAPDDATNGDNYFLVADAFDPFFATL